MTRRQGRAHTARGGFTLIELLLVMVILVILAGTVMLRFSGTTEKARIARAATDVEAITQALKNFDIQVGRFPTTEEGLAALIDKPNNVPASASGWPFLEKGVPLDPWGKPYIYRCPPTQSKSDFDLLSGGPDGQEGGGDDITSWEQH